MNTLSYKTISANKETATKEWVVIDASDQVVGRLASKVAKLLRGKYKPNFTPHVDCGDNVILINAQKVVFTGKKETDKVYTRYTGYPGGQRFQTPAELRKRKDGVEIVPNDDPKIMDLLKQLWATGDTQMVTVGVLGAEAIWGEDLNKIPGLAAMVKQDLDLIQSVGMLEAVKSIL
jgi:ribosomal protein L13